MSTLHTFDSRSALEHSLCQRIMAALTAAIAERGQASLAVPGGSTPIALFDLLSQQALDWAKVTLTLTDERWVSSNDASSNEKQLREHLLQHHAASAQFVGLKNSAHSAHSAHFAHFAHDGAAQASAAIASISNATQLFDVVLLGMGNDGHTASLFPHDPASAAALGEEQMACAATHAPNPPHERISLNRAALLNTRQIFLHITGPDKASVYAAADHPGPLEEYPVRLALHQTKVPCDVFWTA